MKPEEPKFTEPKPVEPQPWSTNALLNDLCSKRFSTFDEMTWHMPILWTLAKDCTDCVEFGLRRANSTVALLAGCRGGVISYDVDVYHDMALYEAIGEAVGDRWHRVESDSLLANFDSCDLLLHDSLHNYDHVRQELSIHAGKVRKYILLHDTVVFGQHGQVAHKKPATPGVAGMQQAIDEFLGSTREWDVKMNDKTSSGLLVLERRT